jgi:hypothetical protein
MQRFLASRTSFSGAGSGSVPALVRLGGLAALLAIGAASCGDSGILGGTTCETVDDCETGQLCVATQCVDIGDLGDVDLPDGALPDVADPDTDASETPDTDVVDPSDADVAPDADTTDADTTDADTSDVPDATDADGGDTVSPGLCGNNRLEGTEQCDDGDNDDTNECTNACEFQCGNGLVGDFETCDIGIPAGEEGACPTVCETDEACSEARLEGEGCTAVCVVNPIAVCDGTDGCCGVGCSAADDLDCTAECGNSILEPGETCDPAGSCPSVSDCLDDSACTTESVVGDPALCTAECSSAPVETCTSDDGCCGPGCTSATDNDCSARCGDGIVDDGETCDGDCPTTCAPANSCSTASLIGDADTCSVECVQAPILTPANGDGCCPAGANEVVDNDCAPECGNGVLETGEVCDGACPGSCADADACTVDNAVGSADSCDLTCVQTDITACTNADGCCPSGCNATNDTDCAVLCGNGVVEPGETCDGDCPTTCDDGLVCTRDVLNGTAESCNVACTAVPITTAANGDLCCPSGANATNDNDCEPACGNGVVESGELCEGASCPTSCSDGIVCTTDILTGSVAGCDAVCSFPTIEACFGGDGCCAGGCNATNDSDCAGECGNNVVEPGETCDPLISCPTLLSCNDNVACTTDILVGSGCSVECSNQPITAAISGDGCCAPGANATNDNDCAPICGNGVVESGELCDGASCPTSCNDGLVCTTDTLQGTDCSRICAATPITVPANGDGCCAPGANATNDNDCAPVCGNGVIEAGEICDGASCPTSCNDGLVCTSDVLQGSACSRVCAFTAITAPSNGDLCCPSGANANNDNDCAPSCGNGVTESGELCDGASCPTSCPSDGLACTSDALSGSAGSCNARCAYAAISACTNGDGCCASGCTSANDNDCAAVVSAASVVTTTSTCLPVGQPGPAQAAVQVTLVDTTGGAVSGATVAISSSLGTVSAVTASGNTYSAILSAPNATTGTATITVVANGVTLTTQPAITIAQRMDDTIGGAGSCPANGNLRVRVVDATGAALEGAQVMVGTAPSAAAYASTFGQPAATPNTATTDAQGYVTFRDFGAALDGPQTITAAAAGREYVTFTAMDASDFVIPLRQTRPSVSTTQFRGQLTGITGTGDVEAGLMLTDTTLAALASFSLESLLADNECINVPVAGDLNIPGNVYIPRQTVFIFVTIAEHLYRSAPVQFGTRFLYGIGGNLPVAALTSGAGIAAAVNQLSLTNIGGSSLSVTAPPTANRNIPVSTALTRNVRCNLTNYPAASDVFCVAAGDLDSFASAAQRVGEGRLFIMGFRTAVTTTTTSATVTLNDLTTVNDTGAFAGIEYLSATAALYLDEARVGIPAGTANGISAIFNRAGTDIGAGTTAAPSVVAFNNYLPVRTLSRAGRVLTLGPASSTTSAAPHFTDVVFNQVVDEVYSGCVANDSTRTARYPLWRVIAPATANTIALPTVPTTWPRGDLGGDIQGLIDTAATPETDRIEIRASTTAERDNPSFSYNAFRLVDFVRFATHVASNVIDFAPPVVP